MDAHHRREALLCWLRGRTTATATEAAERFGVSTRTILRDVAALRSCGEPVESDAGRGGGLRIDVLRSLPPVRLRLDDIIALYLWTQIVRMSGAAPADGGVDEALDRMLTVIPATRTTELKKLLRRVVVRPSLTPGTPRHGCSATMVLACFDRAIHSRRAAEIQFAARPGNSSGVYRAELHGILVEAPHWYLVTVDVDTHEPSLVRFDDVADIRVSETLRYQAVQVEDVLQRLARSPRAVAPLRAMASMA